MNRLIDSAAEVLASAGYAVSTTEIATADVQCLVFEGDVAIGFVLVYANASELLHRWSVESAAVVRHHALALRRAGQKAWNAYLILLAIDGPDEGHTNALIEIEEDLVGTRKVARSGVNGLHELRAALLPLLPLQAPPRLEPIDMPAEIAARASEVAPSVMAAFFSSADEAIVLQTMEDAQ